MRAKKVNEEVHFEKGKDPKSVMGIGEHDALMMKKGVDAFTHWLYYVDAKDMIDKAFDGWKHLEDKLRGFAHEVGYLSPDVLMKFVRDLDKGNQRKLYDYIIQNHSDKW